MGTGIGEFKGQKDAGSPSVLYLMSFYGGRKRGPCVQFTVRSEQNADYAQLTRAEVEKLRDTLSLYLGSSETRLQRAIKALLEYRQRNTLNFQLEKLDDYLTALQAIIDEVTE